MADREYKAGDTVGGFRLVSQTDVDFAEAVRAEVLREIDQAAEKYEPFEVYRREFPDHTDWMVNAHQTVGKFGDRSATFTEALLGPDRAAANRSEDGGKE